LQLFDVVGGDEQSDDENPEEDSVGPAKASQNGHGQRQNEVLGHQDNCCDVWTIQSF